MSEPEDYRDVFFQECDELLDDLEAQLARLQAGDADPETVNAAFRAVHSIKGGADAFGFRALVGFAHAFEATMDAIRGGLQAKLFGGARVIALTAAQAVGARNHEFAAAFLRREGIPVTAADVGGERARRVFFRPAENRVLVQMLGSREASLVRDDETRLSRASRAAPASGGVELF